MTRTLLAMLAIAALYTVGCASVPTAPVERKFPTKRVWYFSDLKPGGPALYGFVRILKDGTPVVCLGEEANVDQDSRLRSKVYRDKEGRYITLLSKWERDQLESGEEEALRWVVDGCVPVLVEEPIQ